MTTSPNDTVVRGTGASVTDASGNVWKINSSARITVNGIIDPTTANVDELAYAGGLVWQKNTDNHWYSKTSPSATWVAWTGASPPVKIPAVSANDTIIPAGSAATLVDANGNVWGLKEVSGTKGYQITDDGAIDPTTANVVQLAIVNGVIWQENAAGLWFSKTTPASAWTQGTATDPITGTKDPVSLTWVGGGNNLASNPADWSPAVAPRAGDTLRMTSGTIKIVGNALAGDTLTIPSFGNVNIFTSGAAKLSLVESAPIATANIKIASGSTLSLNAHVTSGNLNISGGTLAFIGGNSFNGLKTVLADTLTGTALLGLTGGNANGEFMEINGAVGSGLTFKINAGSAPDASMQIDHPAEFKGLIDLGTIPIGLGHVAFMGIHATSADLLNGILQMFNGTKVVDTTHVTGGIGVQLHQSSSGVILTDGSSSDVPPGSLGTAIPLHT